jgi:probable rRNA maturation factor
MYQITVQRATRKGFAPTTAQLRQWATQALKQKTTTAEITIRIVTEKEMTVLNATYRQKNKSTNVLSFPFDMPHDVKMDIPLLGDIVICTDVVNQEALDQNKPAEAHWAHMIVHGVLHLLGYDHEIEADALTMEAEEIQILKSLGFNDPYQTTEGNHNG